MRTLRLLIFAVLSISISYSCTNKKEHDNQISNSMQSDEIEVFYFHYTRRCVTCQAVEDVTREAIAEVYGDGISFRNYNLDEEEGMQKAEEVGVSGQTLLIVRGDIQMNITNEGFLLARSNPEKLKQVIAEKIDPLL